MVRLKSLRLGRCRLDTNGSHDRAPTRIHFCVASM